MIQGHITADAATAAIAAPARRREIDALGPWKKAIRKLGAEYHRRGWSLGTSSNYSVVVGRDPLRLLITASGKDKGNLGKGDFVVVDDAGRPVSPSYPKPSAETLLHVVAAARRDVGAVLHTHSVWSTLLSDLFHDRGTLVIEEFEMLKGLAGVTTHEHELRLEIFENTQDIPALSRVIQARLADAANPLRHGFLLRRHGLYTWGRDLDEARRHVEVLEFLFEVVGRRLALANGPAVASLVA